MGFSGIITMKLNIIDGKLDGKWFSKFAIKPSTDKTSIRKLYDHNEDITNSIIEHINYLGLTDGNKFIHYDTPDEFGINVVAYVDVNVDVDYSFNIMIPVMHVCTVDDISSECVFQHYHEQLFQCISDSLKSTNTSFIHRKRLYRCRESIAFDDALIS